MLSDEASSLCRKIEIIIQNREITKLKTKTKQKTYGEKIINEWEVKMLLWIKDYIYFHI